MIAYGRWQPYVPAGRARVWILLLQEYGIGWKRVAVLAGVGAGTVNRLLYGRSGRMVRRIRPVTEAAILAVKPVLANLADNAPVDATGTRRRLRALVAAGWPQRWLARRLGWQPAFFSSVIGHKSRVTAETARAAIALYDQLWDQPPPQATAAERTAVLRARKLAERHGWPPVQAWDDETIDDPRATPADYRRTARLSQAELVEEAEELIRLHGLDRDQAAERLGVTPSCLARAFYREAKARAIAQAAAAAPAHRHTSRSLAAHHRRHRTRQATAATSQASRSARRPPPAGARAARGKCQRPRPAGPSLGPARRTLIRHRAGENAVLPISPTSGGALRPLKR